MRALFACVRAFHEDWFREHWLGLKPVRVPGLGAWRLPGSLGLALPGSLGLALPESLGLAPAWVTGPGSLWLPQCQGWSALSISLVNLRVATPNFTGGIESCSSQFRW